MDLLVMINSSLQVLVVLLDHTCLYRQEYVFPVFSFVFHVHILPQMYSGVHVSGSIFHSQIGVDIQKFV